MFLHTIVIRASVVDILHDPFWQAWIGITISVIVSIVGIVIPIIRERPPRKLVTHQLLSDAPILSVHRGLQQRLRILFDNNPLPDPRLIVLKVRNSGKDVIAEHDYRPAPQFLFPMREVLSSEVIETQPLGILKSQNLTIHRGSLETEEPGSIVLPPIPLNRKDSITLNALLIGPGEESGKSYEPIGRILGGEFLAYEPKRGLSRRTLVFVIPSVFLIGITLTATLLAHFITPQPADCVSGTLNIGGSTAMYPLVYQVGQKYQARCSGVVITVNQNVVGSDSGLIEVENGGIQIGDSDIPAPKDKSDLVDHPVAIVNYVIVVSPGVQGVNNLSIQQLRGIYSGRITNWSQVGGKSLPIYVISRSQSSGTRQTFQSYVLGCIESLSGPSHEELNAEADVAKEVQQKSDAIGYIGIGTAFAMQMKYLTIENEQATPESIEANNYKFWAIEHMYTKGIVQGLAKSFLDYMTGDSARVIANSLHYVDYNLMTPNALNTRQSTPAITAC